MRRDFPLLARTVHGKPLAWLDNAATTQKPEAVISAVDRFYRTQNSNIHRGAHTMARQATELYEAARERVAAFLGAADPREIVFTRGTTEALNLIAQSHGRSVVGPGDEVLVTELEHHANIVPWQVLCAERGAQLKVVPFNDRGEIDPAAFAHALSPRTKIAAFAHVSNVLGTVLPVRELAALAHAHGATVVVDGAQAVAHLPVAVRDLNADFYVLSGHKLFAPTGIGALYGRLDLLEAMPPWQVGGGMIESVAFDHTDFAPPPQRFEAGTAHIAGAIGLATAIDYLASIDLSAARSHEASLHAYARTQLGTVPRLRLLGDPRQQISVLTFTIDGTDPAHTAARLDEAGIMARAGHHCAQPALRHYGLSAATRVSLALYNTYDEIDKLLGVLRTP
ncbi:cysteine desulfurase [Catenulispora rubra]|uniref:cysteine desulfurase n=1 Tax=Catenulispora rubra TaxID=280293 RepID=UPI001E6539FD|nr:cysteine desulfurase [Catenulispora rubra]